MGQLYFFIGNPRSGKSTLARQYQNFIIDLIPNEISSCPYTERVYPQIHENPRIVINGDSLRLALHGQVYAKEAEGYIACMMEVMARAYLAEDYDVLIDETNTTIASITRWFRVCKTTEPIFINTSKEICIERANKNNQLYLIPVIERCDEQRQYIVDNWDKVKNEILTYLQGHN